MEIYGIELLHGQPIAWKLYHFMLGPSTTVSFCPGISGWRGKCRLVVACFFLLLESAIENLYS